jgi:hypothetical protein
MDDAWKQRPLHAKSVSGLLTAEECEAIKNDALAVGMGRALVRTPKGMRKLRSRTCEVARLPRTKEREWLYERLMTTNEAINAEYWRFALNSIEEVQVLRYKPMQHFDWHFDTGHGLARKLTCVVNLSSPRSYWRGGLEVRSEHHGKSQARLQGAATVFPGRARPGWVSDGP